MDSSMDDDLDKCECRSEWVSEGFLRGVSLCKYCQSILRETGLTEEELKAEAKSLKLVLDWVEHARQNKLIRLVFNSLLNLIFAKLWFHQFLSVGVR